MSAKDSQFIERALVHPWMFWVFFWKWPRIVRQICSEYDLVAKDRDAAKAAHEQAVAANEKVRKWIHVTHQLDATADLRAIWTAGKRLSIFLVFFVVTNAFGQAPPYLRNQWTTNANPLALKVISTNGVRVATNVWELDFTNTATVTVSAVSNANKVMVSFTGSASGSSSLTNALLHAGPTNGSVGALVLTAGNGVTLTTSGTNRIAAIDTNVVAEISDLLWTNFYFADALGNLTVGIRDLNTNGSIAYFAANRNDDDFGGISSIVSIGYDTPNTSIGTNATSVLNLGDKAGKNQKVAYGLGIIVNIGYGAGENQVLTNGSREPFNLGDNAGANQEMNQNSTYAYNLGAFAGLNQKLHFTDYVFNFGSRAGGTGIYTNSTYVHNFGHQSGEKVSIIGSEYLMNIGHNAGSWASTSNSFYVFNFGYEAGGGDSSAEGCFLTNSRVLFNYGYGTAQKQISLNSTSIYNYGTFAGSNQVVNGATRYYTYGAYSGAASQVTNSVDIYGFGTYSFRDAHINDSTNLFGSGIDTFEHALLTNSHNITAIGFETLENAKLTNSIDIIAIGNRVGLSGSGLEDIIILGNDISSALSHQVVLGAADQTNLIQGSLQVTSGTLGAGKVLTDANGDGFATWQTVSGGSGIASIYTNNVLAGGPGLTELEFTNTSSVTWVATTNAGRVTMSATSAAGAQTPWASDIDAAAFSLANFGSTLSFTNGSKIGATATNTLTLTNSHLVFSPDNLWDIGASGATRPRNGYFGGFLRPGVGSASTPSLNFGTAGSGIYDGTGSGEVTIATGSTRRFAFNGEGFYLIANASAIIFGSSTDLRLTRPSAGNLAVGASSGADTGTILTSNVFLSGSASITNSLNVSGGITNGALTASKFVRTDATKKLVSSSFDESDIAGKQLGSDVLTNLTATKAFTNVTRTVITNVGVSLYTVPAGCKYIYVECVGGGGGGGGVDGAASQSAAGGGGGSGAYCTTNIVNPAASYIVTVGTNGLGGAAAAGVNNGTIGGTTLFTNILTALGGSGGSGDASAAAVGFAIGGAGALETATGYIYSGGSPGQHGICMSGTLAVSGGGAGSIFGGGGAPQTAAAGANATGKGAGGSGAAATTNVDRAGGNGSPGMIMIREYYQ